MKKCASASRGSSLKAKQKVICFYKRSVNQKTDDEITKWSFDIDKFKFGAYEQIHLWLKYIPNVIAIWQLIIFTVCTSYNSLKRKCWYFSIYDDQFGIVSEVVFMLHRLMVWCTYKSPWILCFWQMKNWANLALSRKLSIGHWAKCHLVSSQ